MGPELIVFPSMFLMFTYLIYSVANVLTRRQRVRSSAELQVKLLDRIGTIDEFGRFLNTEGGQQYLEAIATEPAGGEANQRVLRALQSGLVLVCVGTGIFIYVGSVRLPSGAYENVTFLATVATAVGVGLLISAFVSLRMSKRLGLINGRPQASATPVADRSA